MSVLEKNLINIHLATHIQVCSSVTDLFHIINSPNGLIALKLTRFCIFVNDCSPYVQNIITCCHFLIHRTFFFLLQVIHDFLFSLKESPEKFQIVTNFPRRVLPCLHELCAYSDDEEIIQYLIKHGADTNAKDKKGNTPTIQ